jgi:hypothetical protein
VISPTNNINLAFACRNIKINETSVRVDGFPGEIKVKHLPNMSQENYQYMKLLGSERNSFFMRLHVSWQQSPTFIQFLSSQNCIHITIKSYESLKSSTF